MKGCRTVVPGALLVLGVLTGAGGPAAAQQPSGDDFHLVELVTETGDHARALGRARAARRLIGMLVEKRGLEAPRGAALARLYRAIYGLLRREELPEPTGERVQRSYRATISLDQADRCLLEALDCRSLFGREEFVLVPGPGPWYTGPELDPDAVARAQRALEQACAAHLEASGFRQAPPGTGPEAAGLVVRLSGELRLEPNPGGAGGRGRLRCFAVQGRLHERRTEQVVRFELRQDLRRAPGSLAGVRPGEAHAPQVRADDDLPLAVEQYAREVGELLARTFAQRLYLLRRQEQPLPEEEPPAGPTRACPGCSEVVPVEPSTCPICAAPAPS